MPPKGLGYRLSTCIIVGCLIVWILLLWHSGLLLGFWPILFAAATAIIGLFPPETKTWFFVGATVLLAVGMLLVPLEYLSDPNLNTLHWSCRKSMLLTIYDTEKRRDSDHDSFSVDCEEQEQGNDHDATRIPALPGLKENISPSFNSQFKRTCKIAADATAFDFYHAGLIGKSAESYRFSIQGASLVCPVGENDRKDAKMRCPFSPDFLEAFHRIQHPNFSMTIDITVANQSAPEEFNTKCQKL